MADDPVKISAKEEAQEKTVENENETPTDSNENTNDHDDENGKKSRTNEEPADLSCAKKEEKDPPEIPADFVNHPNPETETEARNEQVKVADETQNQVERLDSTESASLITQMSISAASSASAIADDGDDLSAEANDDHVDDTNADLDLELDLDLNRDRDLGKKSTKCKLKTVEDLKNPEEVTKKMPLDDKQKEEPSTSTASSKKTAKKLEKKPQLSKLKRRALRSLSICFINLKYDIVRTVAERFGLAEVTEDEAWSSHILWTDASITLDQVLNRQRFQLVNHFPGILDISRKDLLSRNLNRMKLLFPNEYDIFPKTWNLPTDLGSLKMYAQSHKNEAYICKPEFSSQGQGIFLLKNLRDLSPFGPRMICQLYIARPFLIDSLKFDLRIYVLITSIEPLRIYRHQDALARFATVKYHPPTLNNANNSFMHLTNYSVNKYSRNFVSNDPGENGNDESEEDEGCGRGSKRRFSTILHWLDRKGCNTTKLMQSIDDVIIKTIVSANPTLKHNYHVCFPHHTLSQSTSACFEILGFDIILDYKLKPYVLEVNHSPSFHTDTKLDEELKSALLRDTFYMLNLRRRLDRQRAEAEGRKRAQERLFTTKHALHLHGNTGQGHGAHSNGLRGKGVESSWMSGGPSSEQLEQFQWEMEHPGGYSLIYPIPNCDVYEQFFEQGISSFLHEMVASSATSKKLPQTRVPYLKNLVSTTENEPNGTGTGTGSGSGKSNLNIKHDRDKKKSLVAVSRTSNISTNPWAQPTPKFKGKGPRPKILEKEQNKPQADDLHINSNLNDKTKLNNKEKEQIRLQLVNFQDLSLGSGSESGPDQGPGSGSFLESEPVPVQPLHIDDTKLKRPRKKVIVKPPQNLPLKKLRIQNLILGAKTNQRKKNKDPTTTTIANTTTTTTTPPSSPFTSASSSSFAPIIIDVHEELDRLRGIMQRGILVENLGVELRVLNLLKQNGGLKSADEEYFREKYGFYEAAILKSDKSPDLESESVAESNLSTDDSNSLTKSNPTDEASIADCDENSEEISHDSKDEK